MRRFIIPLFALCHLCFFSIDDVMAQTEPISRADGYVLIWQSIARPTASTKATFDDVKKDDTRAPILFYGKARKLLDDTQSFFPDDPLLTSDALLWIFRTRNVEPVDEGGSRMLSEMVEKQHLADLVELYDIMSPSFERHLSKDELLTLMRSIDEALKKEHHEASLYSEQFHGKGGAFGEQFNMHALTAAHRTFPHNTLVKVTNLRNGKTVIVRINDRGPYVKGRDMDLSLAAFLQIEDRSRGVIQATFERLGDNTMIDGCQKSREQKRIRKSIILTQGVPHTLALGKTLTLSSIHPFVVRDIIYPHGDTSGMQTWVTRGEDFLFTPSIPGVYQLIVGTKDGYMRLMKMEVVDVVCGG